MVTFRSLHRAETMPGLLARSGVAAIAAMVLFSGLLFGDREKPPDACAAWGFEGVLIGARLKADGTIETSERPNFARVEFVLHKPPRLKLAGQKGAEFFLMEGARPRVEQPGAVVLE